jgi:hypothetical protein
MSYDLNKIWLQLGIDKSLSALYQDFAFQAARIISMLRDPQADIKNIRKNNPVVFNQLTKLLESFKKQFDSTIRTAIERAWEMSEQKNDSQFMKLIKSSGAIVTGERLLAIFNRVHKDPSRITIENILSTPRNYDAFAAFLKNDLKLSPRVWKVTQQNLAMIKQYIASGISEGQSAATITLDLKRYLNEPDKRFRRIRDKETGKLKLSAPAKDYHPGQGVYRSSFQNARRLAATEINMAYRRADIDRWQNMDFVFGYEVHTSARHDITDICDEMKGKYPKGFVFVGWHPLCRCYCTTILPSDEEFLSYLETDKVPSGSMVKGIPPTAHNFVKDNSAKLAKSKSKPFWLENFTPRKGVYYLKKSIV